MGMDIAKLWDFSDPALSEQRFREMLESAEGDDALILKTQIARSGERRLFDNALKVTCERAIPGNLSPSQYREYIEKHGYGDWSVTLAPVDGGILETGDLYLNQAPESGYAPQMKVIMNESDNDYEHQVYPRRHYYYHAMNGKIFGSLEVAFEPYAKRDKCVLLTKVKYNPNGSRNLAIRKRR